MGAYSDRCSYRLPGMFLRKFGITPPVRLVGRVIRGCISAAHLYDQPLPDRDVIHLPARPILRQLAVDDEQAFDLVGHPECRSA
ncbi:hypothetical protein D3C85_1370090 [compost metagenome]